MAAPVQLDLVHITKPIPVIVALGCCNCGRPLALSPFVTTFVVCRNPACGTSYKFQWTGTAFMPQYRFEAIQPEEKTDGKE